MALRGRASRLHSIVDDAASGTASGEQVPRLEAVASSQARPVKPREGGSAASVQVGEGRWLIRALPMRHDQRDEGGIALS